MGDVVTVLGANGFIGLRLCEKLIANGHRVRAVGRSLNPADFVGSATFTGDIDDDGLLRDAVSGANIVYHLASSATPASSADDILGDLKVAVGGAIKVMEACRAGGARLVFVSSGGTVYGVAKSVPIAESAPCDPITPYGVSKLAVEKYLRVYGVLHGLDYRILRVSNPYGPRQRARFGQGAIAAFLSKAAIGEPIEIWGDGEVVRDYLYIDDLVEALERVGRHDGAGKLFNIGSGVGVSLNTIISEIEVVLNRQVKRRYVQGRKIDTPINVLDVAAAERDLGWRATTSLRAGLLKTWNWLDKEMSS